MKDKESLTGSAVIVVILFALLGFWQMSARLREVVEEPFRMLFGTHMELTVKLMEVSDSMQTVRSASRQLLKPLGVLSLQNVFPSSSDGSATASAANSSEPAP